VEKAENDTLGERQKESCEIADFFASLSAGLKKSLSGPSSDLRPSACC
jgi:hypothetical protein